MSQLHLPYGIKISMPAYRALQQANIVKLEDLTNITLVDLSKLHGMGPKTLAQLQAELEKRGLTFANQS